jgi:hypothetical protein
MRDWNDAAIRHALASLSACLKTKGHTVFLIDLRSLSGWEEYEEVLKTVKPDCLGVTSHTCEHDLAIRSCELAKRVGRAILTVAGGIQPTRFPNAFLETGNVDYVLQGVDEALNGPASVPRWIAYPDAAVAQLRAAARSAEITELDDYSTPDPRFKQAADFTLRSRSQR